MGIFTLYQLTIKLINFDEILPQIFIILLFFAHNQILKTFKLILRFVCYELTSFNGMSVLT